MSEPLALSALKAKRSEIERQIDSLEKQIVDARSNLIHIAAVIRIFDPNATDDRPAPGYLNTTKALPRSQLFKRCQEALRASPEPLSTRELARHIITASGWDIEDRKLRLAVAHRIGAALVRFAVRGQVLDVGERDRATLWRLPS